VACGTVSACSIDNRQLELASGRGGAAGVGVAGELQGLGGRGASGGVASHAAGQGGESGAAAAPIPVVDGCADLDSNKVADCSETIVKNPDFKADVNRWFAGMDTTVVWNEANAGDLPSGSALVASEGVIEEGGAGLALRAAQQCVPIDGAKLVLVYANAFVDSDQDEQGRAEIDLAFFDSEDCTGALSTSFTTPQPLDAGPGVWLTLKAGSVSGATTKSAQVKLSLLKPFRAKSFQAQFDNVLVKAENAQP